MAILKVARLGHPVIRQKAQAVTPREISSAPFQDLIEDMIETMREYEGVGLAAPQVHISKQIAVIEVKLNRRYPQAPKIPLTILINPVLSQCSQKMESGWEGCLSIPDLRGIVPRHESLICEALDRTGNAVRFEARDFFARVIQHEWDHLQGKVYLDRMNEMTSLCHLAEFTKFWEEK